MFESADEAAVLKSRIRLLELRKQRLLAASQSGNPTANWLSGDLERIESEMQQAKLELAEREGAK